MKTQNLLTATVILLASAGISYGDTILFDDIPTIDPGGLAMPSGYGSLDWNNFVLLNTSVFPYASGYQVGTVSGNNIAVNAGGFAALVSRASSFDLFSGYFTAAWNNGLQLEVQGFSGASMIYDNTYTIGTAAPTLITLNYYGVDSVNFITSGGTPDPVLTAPFGGLPAYEFALDNLTIPETGSSFLMFASGLAGIGALRRKLR